MIEYYLLEQFVAFAECGTLLGASEKIHISQPALSRSMKKIEDELGVPLFHRENSKISLNETGKVAAEYARRALDANREMVSQVLFFDKSLRTVNVGSCTIFPLNVIMPDLQERLLEKTISTETADDEKLIKGLKNRQYQLAILHENPDDKALFCQRFLTENLYISVDEKNPLAKRKSVSLEELKDLHILMDVNAGFWKDIAASKIPRENLLIQNSFDAFCEVVESSLLPLFNTDQYIARGYNPPGRKSVPVSDEAAHVTYWLCCLSSEQKNFRSVFNAVRGKFLSGK